MSTNAFANNCEIASKGSSGKSVACFPDTCWTPPTSPASPTGVAIPYPNTAQCSDLDKGSSKVLVCGKMAALEDSSYMKKSMGDEAATQSLNKGLITAKIQGKAFFAQWSQNVKFEGKGVARHMDMTTHNHG